MEQPTCKSCRYFLLIDGKNVGLCRRYPPYSDFVVIKSALASDSRQAQRSYFPRVTDKEWCGEWTITHKELELRLEKQTREFYNIDPKEVTNEPSR